MRRYADRGLARSESWRRGCGCLVRRCILHLFLRSAFGERAIDRERGEKGGSTQRTGSDARLETLRGVAVDVGVFVLAEAEDGGGTGVGDAG